MQLLKWLGGFLFILKQFLFALHVQRSWPRLKDLVYVYQSVENMRTRGYKSSLHPDSKQEEQTEEVGGGDITPPQPTSHGRKLRRRPDKIGDGSTRQTHSHTSGQTVWTICWNFLRACAYETPLVHAKTFLPTSMKNIFPFHAGPCFGCFRQAKLVMTVHCRQLCSFSSLMVQKLDKFRETVVTKGKTMTSPTGMVGFGLDGPGGFSIHLR